MRNVKTEELYRAYELSECVQFTCFAATVQRMCLTGRVRGKKHDKVNQPAHRNIGRNS